MKKLLFLSLATLLIFTISCNDDGEKENPNPEVSGDEVTFGSNPTNIQSAVFAEAGNYDVLKQDYEEGEETLFVTATHFGNVFRLSDGDLDTANATFSGGEILIRTELFSSGAGRFRRGVFSFIDKVVLNGQPSIAQEQNYFTELVVEYQGEESRATAGTVSIAGTSPDWTISFDVTLGVSTTLQGSYAGGMTKLE